MRRCAVALWLVCVCGCSAGDTRDAGSGGGGGGGTGVGGGVSSGGGGGTGTGGGGGGGGGSATGGGSGTGGGGNNPACPSSGNASFIQACLPLRGECDVYKSWSLKLNGNGPVTTCGVTNGTLQLELSGLPCGRALAWASDAGCTFGVKETQVRGTVISGQCFSVITTLDLTLSGVDGGLVGSGLLTAMGEAMCNIPVFVDAGS